MYKRIIIGILMVSACVALVCQPSQAQKSNLRITGTVVGISGRLAGRTRPFTLIVNSYTSGAQIAELTEATQRGEDQLLSTLSHMNAGRIQVGTGVGVPANAIIASPWERGTKLTVLYQRSLGFYELRYGRRSEDYRFGYAELLLDQGGKGEGTWISAARVRLKDGNTWEVEDFGVFPARLMGLRSSGTVLPR